MDQPRLFEFRMGDRSPEKLVVAEANRDAAKLLTDWRMWPGGALALAGPSGAGKTHLALAWAHEAKARQISALAVAEDAAAIFKEADGRLLIDDADRERDEAMFWRVLDLARTQRGAVLWLGQARLRPGPPKSPISARGSHLYRSLSLVSPMKR